MQYIKHLISFLLIFGLTVNACSIYSQINSDKQHQVSSVQTRNETSHKHYNVYVYGKKTLPKKACSARITYRNLQDVYSTQTRTVLKLRMTLYQKIDSTIAQSLFLNKRITSSNPYSSLYTA